MNRHTPTLLIVLDGFGYNPDLEGNAIAAASMPHWHEWMMGFPHTLLAASGSAVGLPEGYMGNSEVGHLTIGAGRHIKSLLSRFNHIIEDGTFFEYIAINQQFQELAASNNALHIMGLVSDAGVHSTLLLLEAFLRLAKKNNLKIVYIHAFLDGRDTLAQSAATYLAQVDAKCTEIGLGVIASIHGRFYAMDRDNNWDRTEKSYNVLLGSTPANKKDWKTALEDAYKKHETDEFVTPTLLDPDGYIKAGDGMICINFRADRARQLASSLLEANFNSFKRKKTCYETYQFYISPIFYKESFSTNPKNIILFEQPTIKNTLLDVLAAYHKRVFIIAETEKYAHVTYFFRGEHDITLSNETRVLVPSIKAKNYKEHPEMSGVTITDKLLTDLERNAHDFYLINYANADMVGHSADFFATKQACEFLDNMLGKLYQSVVIEQGGTIFITGDHGNAEQLIDPLSGKPCGTHTRNPVPFLILDKKYLSHNIISNQEMLGLENIAPTILKHLNLDIPHEMTKTTIINIKNNGYK